MESRRFAQMLPVFFLLVLTLAFSLATGGRFTSAKSLKIIFEQALIVGTVSTGAAFIFASGNVSLSMGVTTVLTATLAVMFYNATQNLWLTIFVSMAIGVLLMGVSALLSTMMHVRVIYITIIMMTLLAAIQQSLLSGSTVSMPRPVILQLKAMNFHYLSFGAVLLVSIVLFHLTAIGRSLRMLGTNAVCAEQTGIRMSKYLLIAFLFAGVTCGIGAMQIIVRAASVGQTTLLSLNMDCMLALVLGGMSIFGGSRSYVLSGMLGAVTVCVLNQGLLMVGLDTSIIQGVRGLLFLALVCTSQKRPKYLPAPEG